MIGGRGEDRIDRPATYGTHMEHVNSNITRRWVYHAATREREQDVRRIGNFPPATEMSAARSRPALLSPDQRAPARMRVPQLAAEITRNKKLDRVSHVHARPPSLRLTAPACLASSRECGTQPA